MVNAALSVRHTLQFIRTVLTLRDTITHLVLVYTLHPMGTLELVCLRLCDNDSFKPAVYYQPCVTVTILL